VYIERARLWLTRPKLVRVAEILPGTVHGA
jgi:hypothetical protein